MIPLRQNHTSIYLKIILIVFGLLFVSILSGCIGNQPDEEDNGITDNEDKGENFSFTALDGTDYELKEFRGTIVLVDFWASWCYPCQIQMLELIKIYENYTRSQVEILSVNMDPRDSDETIEQFLQEFEKYGYPLHWIFVNDDGTLWETYHLSLGSIPTLYIFDQKGNIYFSHEGFSVYSEIPEGFPESTTILQPMIEELLSEGT